MGQKPDFFDFPHQVKALVLAFSYNPLLFKVHPMRFAYQISNMRFGTYQITNLIPTTGVEFKVTIRSEFIQQHYDGICTSADEYRALLVLTPQFEVLLANRNDTLYVLIETYNQDGTLTITFEIRNLTVFVKITEDTFKARIPCNGISNGTVYNWDTGVSTDLTEDGFQVEYARNPEQNFRIIAEGFLYDASYFVQ